MAPPALATAVGAAAAAAAQGVVAVKAGKRSPKVPSASTTRRRESTKWCKKTAPRRLRSPTTALSGEASTSPLQRRMAADLEEGARRQGRARRRPIRGGARLELEVPWVFARAVLTVAAEEAWGGGGPPVVGEATLAPPTAPPLTRLTLLYLGRELQLPGAAMHSLLLLRLQPRGAVRSLLILLILLHLLLPQRSSNSSSSSSSSSSSLVVWAGVRVRARATSRPLEMPTAPGAEVLVEQALWAPPPPLQPRPRPWLQPSRQRVRARWISSAQHRRLPPRRRPLPPLPPTSQGTFSGSRLTLALVLGKVRVCC